MKLSKVFTIVLVSHLGVIAVLLVQPGCQRKPHYPEQAQSQPIGEQAIVTQEVYYQEQPVHSDFNAGLAPSVSQPTQVTTSKEGRYPPKRPVPIANIVTTYEPEIIETSSVEAVDYSAPEPPMIVETVDTFQAINPDLQESAVQTYAVSSGDNLTKIARKQGVSLQSLMRANGLNKKSTIYVGQSLIIPSAGVEMSTAPKATVAEAPRSDVTEYVVVPGDSLSRIARKHGTSVSALKAANGLSNNNIFAGQLLQVPQGNVQVVPVQSTWSAPTTTSKPEPAIKASEGESKYQVVSGDTLGAIAKRADVSVSALMKRNGITDPRKLRAGQTLVIPGIGQSMSSPAAVQAPQPRTSVTPKPPVISEPVAPRMTLDELERLEDLPAVSVETQSE